MLASPIHSTAFNPHHPAGDHARYRPAKDKESFINLLPAAVEFVEGSSSGTLLIADGRYEPVNGSPKPSKRELPPHPLPSYGTPQNLSKKRKVSPSKHGKSVELFSRTLETTWPKGTTVGAGLNNTGNSCFLNSALQCLLHTPPLLHVLMAHGNADPCSSKGGFCMSCQLREVMMCSHGTGYKRKSFTPFQISQRLPAIAKHMVRGRQEDSHEFLRYAIDALQKSCLAGLPSKLDSKIAETSWVHKIFGGTLRSRVTCSQCHHNSDTFDRILDLSLDIMGSHHLKEALQRFTKVDHLNGANKYKCEKCKRLVAAQKQFTIHEAPLILTIHLKRFSPLGRKIGHLLRYDERVSLVNVMSDRQYGPSYSLYGVVSHAGGGPNSGHYYAHVKGANGQWFEMNDDSVTRNHASPTSMKNAYMLFYIRDKGQALEAAVRSDIASVPFGNGATLARNGVVASMKKRRISTSDEEGDFRRLEKRPFIGPLLPSPLPAPLPSRDPQADVLEWKIANVSKSSTNATALQSLSQYADDDDDEDIGEKFDSPTDVHTTSQAAAPPSLLSPANSASSSPIPTSSFYGRAPVNGKKRKSPDSEEHPRRSFSLHSDSPSRTEFGFSRQGSNGRNGFVHPFRKDRFSKVNYRGHNKKRIIM